MILGAIATTAIAATRIQALAIAALAEGIARQPENKRLSPPPSPPSR
jgi:F0F1-type ATP synthase membrane subunit c/vacuolar-type H+-ATPase subunit K